MPLSKKTGKSQYTKPLGETEEVFSFPKEPAKPLRQMVMERLNETGQMAKWQARGEQRAKRDRSPPPRYTDAAVPTMGVEMRSFTEEEERDREAWRARCAEIEAQNEELRKKIAMIDSEAAFYVDHKGTGDDDVKFHYSAIADLPKKFKLALRRLDTDGDGEISLAEMLHAEQQNSSLGKQVLYLTLALGAMIGATFLVSLSASTMAQTTETSGNMLVPKGGSKWIAQTAPAEQEMAVALTPLLTGSQLAMVKDLSVSNLGAFISDGSFVRCKVPTICPEIISMNVEEALKISQTETEFRRTDGMVVNVNMGNITVYNVPGFGSSRFNACASATCSKVRVKGISVAALEKKAAQLNFIGYRPQDLGGRRGFFSNVCKVEKNTHKKGSDWQPQEHSGEAGYNGHAHTAGHNGRL